MTNDSRFSVEGQELHIDLPDVEHRGVYTCHKNKTGAIISGVNFHVQCKYLEYRRVSGYFYPYCRNIGNTVAVEIR